MIEKVAGDYYKFKITQNLFSIYISNSQKVEKLRDSYFEIIFLASEIKQHFFLVYPICPHEIG